MSQGSRIFAGAILVLLVGLACTWALHGSTDLFDRDPGPLGDVNPPGDHTVVSSLTDAAGHERRATCRTVVDGRSVVLSVRGRCELTVAKDDPLVSDINRGVVTSKDIAHYVVGTSVAYFPHTPPGLTYSRSSPTATVAIEGSSAGLEIVEFDQLRLTLHYLKNRDPEERSGLVSSLSTVVELRGLTVAAIHGRADLVSRTDERVVFDGPVSEELRLHVRSAKIPAADFRPYPSPPPADDDAPDPTYGFLVISVLIGSLPIAVHAVRPRTRRQRQLRGAAILTAALWLPVTAAAIVTSGWLPVDRDYSSMVFGGFLFVATATAVVALWRFQWTARTPDAEARASPLLFAIAVLLAGGAMARARGGWSGLLEWTLLAVPGTVLAAALCAVVALLWGGRAWLRYGLCVGAAVGASAFLFGLAVFADSVGWRSVVMMVPLVAGLALYPPVAALADRLRIGNAGKRTLLVLCAVLMLPTVALLRDPFEWDELPTAWPDLLDKPGTLVLAWIVFMRLLLIANTVVHLRSRAGSARLYDGLTTRLAVVSVLMLVLPTAGEVTFSSVFAQVLMFAMFLWLTSGRSAEAVLAAARVSAAEHRQRLRTYVRGRVLQASAIELLQSAKSKISAGELDVNRFDEILRDLDGELAAERRDDDRRAAALGSSSGASPWANAVAAARLGAFLAVPLFAYEIWALAQSSGLSDLSTIVILDYARNIGRWILYAGAFGLCYPLLRGSHPMAKAGCFFLAVAVPEVVAVFNLGFGSETAILALVVRLGQVAFFCFALGLLWERRIVLAGGMVWRVLRDFRSIRSLAAPVSTVLVAAATVVATTVASAAVAPILQSPRPVPEETAVTSPP